ncbi:MAG: radical SAM protein [Firmicutes bacterium]|nr:radical SAM protein [Bacillota bacterium]
MEKLLEIYMECKSTEALGPYKRYGLWLQGCDKACKGCISVESRQIGGGYKKSIGELAKAISSQSEIEGITISGGEPFLQAELLEKLLAEIKQKRDLGVIIYTGYYLEQLKSLEKKKPSINSVLSITDILIDGIYSEELNDGKSLRGSLNQNVLFFTDRYKYVAEEYYNLPNRKVEWIIGNEGMQLVGIPDKKTSEMFLEKLKKTGRVTNELL